ncbi:MAG: PKD domain-containing protein [Saprospiraceae bacterium]|nr:PKD domain-containing protein [Saprospiraceae bacterium]
MVSFIDLSDYKPTDWLWDFGDGTTDTEQRPVHTYQKPGIYNVCLIAYNKHGSSTYCKALECTSTAKEAIAKLLDIKVYPNPAAEFFILESKEPYYYETQLRLLSINGEELQTSKIDLSSGFVTIEIGNIDKGMYFVEVKGREGILYRGKLVLVECRYDWYDWYVGVSNNYSCRKIRIFKLRIGVIVKS